MSCPCIVQVNNRERQTIIPVTIKQLLDATQGGEPDDSYKIDGADIHQVRRPSLVGIEAGLASLSITTCPLPPKPSPYDVGVYGARLTIYVGMVVVWVINR